MKDGVRCGDRRALGLLLSLGTLCAQLFSADVLRGVLGRPHKQRELYHKSYSNIECHECRSIGMRTFCLRPAGLDLGVEARTRGGVLLDRGGQVRDAGLGLGDGSGLLLVVRLAPRQRCNMA